MSDERLRQLERRWKETGVVEDEAAYLLERVRSGDMSREKLELAAYCGHPAALLPCQGFDETSYFPAHAKATDLSEASVRSHFWAMGLERWGTEVEARAAVAAIRAVLPLWLDWPGTVNDSRPLDYVAAVEVWLDQRSVEAAKRAQSLSDRGGREVGGAPNRIRWVLSAAHDLAGFLTGRDAEEVRTCSGGSGAYAAIDAAMGALAESGDDDPEGRICSKVREELVNWALCLSHRSD